VAAVQVAAVAVADRAEMDILREVGRITAVGAVQAAAATAAVLEVIGEAAVPATPVEVRMEAGTTVVGL